jgi:hypothetical protein
MPEFIKHLVECNCILKQFELIEPPVFHKFVVFSIINDDGSLKSHFSKCNNCGAVHRVMEVGSSRLLKRETVPALPTIDEIKTQLPEKLVDLVSVYNLELPSWQEIKFIYENEKWERPVILTREEEDGEKYGKYLLLVSKTLWSINTFSTEDI